MFTPLVFSWTWNKFLILIRKLEKYDITGTALAWFILYTNYVYIYMYICSHFKRKTKSRWFSLIRLPFAYHANRSLSFVRLLTKEQSSTNGSYQFANRPLGLNGLAYLCLFFRAAYLDQPFLQFVLPTYPIPNCTNLRTFLFADNTSAVYTGKKLHNLITDTTVVLKKHLVWLDVTKWMWTLPKPSTLYFVPGVKT